MKISIFGCGFVGLVTGACFGELDNDVTCVDLDENRVATINKGTAPFFEPDLDELLRSVQSNNRLTVSTDTGVAAGADFYFLAVGTPTHEGKIDLAQIVSAAKIIGDMIKDQDGYPVVVVKSTVVPGTTNGVVRETLEQLSGKRAGQDFGLCMNPEFLREGCAVSDFRDPDRIVMGCSDERTADLVASLYQSYDCPKFVTTPSNAEMSKYASNCLLATLISFSNEFARLCEQIPETDVEQVMDSLAMDRRLSPRVDGQVISPGMLSYLRPGIGYGGSCLPKDVKALRHLAQSSGVAPRLMDAVDTINQERAREVVDAVTRASGDLSGKKVAVLGLAFKPGTDDTRESPGLKVIDLLVSAGADVTAYDPMVSEVHGKHAADVTVAPDLPSALDKAEAAIIATSWPEFAAYDWSSAMKIMSKPIVADGRNMLFQRPRPDEMIYLPVGRREAALE